MRINITILFLVLFIGCTTTKSIDISDRTYIYREDYSKVFQAILTYCDRMNFSVTTIKKDSGIININYIEKYGTTLFFSHDYRAKVNFILRKISEIETQVIATILEEQEGALDSWQQTTLLEDQAIEVYERIFAGISKNIK